MTECDECGKTVTGISGGKGPVQCRTCSPFGLPTRYVGTDDHDGSGSPEEAEA